MRLKKLAAFVAISVCLTATAWGSNWDAVTGLWSNAGNWDTTNVPDAASANPAEWNAYIGNGYAATLQSDVPNITTLDVVWYSSLDIKNGALLTTTGDANIAGGGLDEGSVTQSGGALTLGANLTLGNTSGDFATWTMTSDGALAVANDLVVAGSGEAMFQINDDSSLTVGGALSVGGSGGGVGALGVEGNLATINVASYEQTASGTLGLVLNADGIATINVSGNVNLDGLLTVNADALAPGTYVYDLIVSDGGTVNGPFGFAFLGPTMQVKYELNESGKEAVRLYVDTEATEVPILGQLPGDAYDKIISMNIKGHPSIPGNPGPDLTPDVEDGAGAVAADNWNNLVYGGVAPIETAVETYDHTQLVDNSGAVAVSMSLTQNGYDRRPGASIGDSADPNLNLYASQASAVHGGGSGVHTLLEGLQAEFPNGYDLIVNLSKWGGEIDYGSIQRITVYDGPDGGATELAEFEVVIPHISYHSGRGFREEENYVILRNLPYDTVDLRIGPEVANLSGGGPDGWNSIQITGVQVLGLAPDPTHAFDFITDDEDPECSVGWNWDESAAADAWDGGSRETLVAATNSAMYMIWAPPPELPIADDYDVYVWYSAEDPSNPGTYLDRDSAAEYRVYYDGWQTSGGYTTIIIDQDRRDDVYGSGKWVLLGTFPFGGDGTFEAVALLRGAGSAGDGPTSGDAVMWRWPAGVPLDPPVVPIPEPGGLALIGLALLAVRRRRS